MSDNCIAKNYANLTKPGIESLELSGRGELQLNASVAGAEDVQIECDHMYATHHEQNGLLGEGADETQPNYYSTESEVNFIKDFLLIHLDLIQQQNDDIINKENTLYLLQEENTQLREQIKLLQAKLVEAAKAKSADTIGVKSVANHLEDMVIDSTTLSIESSPIISQASSVPTSSVSEEQVGASPAESLDSQRTPTSPFEAKSGRPEGDYSTDYTHSSYTIHSTGSDQMKNLKMSIRRKRVCSNSSALSSNNGSASDEKKSFHQSRKKRKRFVKNECLLTQTDEYLTQVGARKIMDVVRTQELAVELVKAALSPNLEVPRWRVKVYTSCYSLEGTENLEDDVFLRRHSRMENDEKRRKRWDVQRIREQRVIEKLKLRQDKIENNNRTAAVEDAPRVTTLWPTLDDIKFIEKRDELPVAAFGAPIPKLQPSTFSLPWLNLILTSINEKKSLRRTSTASTPANNSFPRRRRSSKR